MVDFAHNKDAMGSGGLRLHYFPDIPTASKAAQDAQGGGRFMDTGFERIDFTSPGGRAASPGGSDETPHDDPDENQVSLSPDQLCEIENQAYARGLETGRAAGIASEQQKVHEIREHLQQVLSALDHYRSELRQTMERDAVTLAMAVARKVVCHELKISRDTVKAVVREAFGKAIDSEQVVVRLNPKDLEFLQTSGVDMEDLLGRSEGVTIEPDEAVSVGGCIIQTRSGDIDARIEKQLQVIGDAFQSELNRSGESV